MAVEAEAVASDAAPAHGDAHGDASQRDLLGFTLQLLREFLATHALSRTAEALHGELAASPLAPDSAALWFDMQQRCRVALAGGKRSIAASSTLEQLVAFVAELPPPRAGGRFALDVGEASASPLTVVAAPKTSAFDGGVGAKHKRALQLGGPAAASFTLMDAFAQSRSPVTLPSRRRRQSQPSPAPASPSAAPSEAEAAPSEPNDRDTLDDSDQEAADGGRAPSEGASSASSKAASLASPQLEASATSAQRKKKRRPRHAHQSVLPPPAYPRSPWGSTALHANAHFAAGRTARVVADFDAPIRRGSEASGAAPSLLEPAPALVRALDASLQRDLCAVRLVDRELRHLRLEKVRANCTGAVDVSSGEDAYARALVLEKFGSAKRQECALCAFPFLDYNLPHRVSFKCVMDVHDAWGYAPPDRGSAAKYRPPLCYDAVRVCRFCAPIVLQYATKGSIGGQEDRPALGESLSVGALPSHRYKPRSRGPALASASSFCSDPYALPPLFADDFMDERDALGIDRSHGSGHAGANGGGGSGLGGSGGGCLLESPAKAIVYANQTDATAFMSAKEWEIINPHRSSIRQVMEKTVRPTAVAEDKQ